MIEQLLYFKSLVAEKLNYIFTSQFNVRIVKSEILILLIIFLSCYFINLRFNIKLLNLIVKIIGLLPTLLHEIGHAISHSLLGGRVQDIKIVLTDKNRKKLGANGFAVLSGGSRLCKSFSTFCGYATAPLIVITSIQLINEKLYLFFVVILVLTFIFYFFNTRQKIFATFLIALALIMSKQLFSLNLDTPNALNIADTLYNILISLLIYDMIISAITMIKVNFIPEYYSNDWDGAKLKQYTLIPSTIWLLIWFVMYSYAIFLVFTR